MSKAEEVRAHIFFAHAHTIRAVIAYCLDLSLERALSIQIGNYSQTIFNFLPHQHAQHVGGQWQVEALNLPALARPH
jgi:broad specificity phosphatase PhoE